jgi:hypothetical protein
MIIFFIIKLKLLSLEITYMSNTYLTTEQLAQRIHYHPRTIRVDLLDKYLIEGEHYIRAFGSRKYLFIWEAVEKTMCGRTDVAIQMPQE